MFSGFYRNLYKAGIKLYLSIPITTPNNPPEPTSGTDDMDESPWYGVIPTVELVNFFIISFQADGKVWDKSNTIGFHKLHRSEVKETNIINWFRLYTALWRS